MVGRNVEISIDIKADIQTYALLSRSSTGMYAANVLFMIVTQCSFPQFADGFGNSVHI